MPTCLACTFYEWSFKGPVQALSHTNCFYLLVEGCSKLKAFSHCFDWFYLIVQNSKFSYWYRNNDHERELSPEHRRQHKNHLHFLLFVPLSFFSICDPVSAKPQSSCQSTDALSFSKCCLHGPSPLGSHSCHITPLPSRFKRSSSTSFGSKSNSDVTYHQKIKWLCCLQGTWTWDGMIQKKQNLNLGMSGELFATK